MRDEKPWLSSSSTRYKSDYAVRYSIFWVARITTLASAILLWMGLQPYPEARLTLESWSGTQSSAA